MQPESKFKRKVDKAFESLFPRKERYHTSIEGAAGQKKGLPDRYYSALGGHAWVESKVKPYELSPLQEVVIARLARAGTRVVVLSLIPSIDEIEAVQINSEGHKCDPIKWALHDVKDKPFWCWLLNPTSEFKEAS